MIRTVLSRWAPTAVVLLAAAAVQGQVIIGPADQPPW
jgi:hypothetical protein